MTYYEYDYDMDERARYCSFFVKPRKSSRTKGSSLPSISTSQVSICISNIKALGFFGRQKLNQMFYSTLMIENKPLLAFQINIAHHHPSHMNVRPQERNGPKLCTFIKCRATTHFHQANFSPTRQKEEVHKHSAFALLSLCYCITLQNITLPRMFTADQLMEKFQIHLLLFRISLILLMCNSDRLQPDLCMSDQYVMQATRQASLKHQGLTIEFNNMETKREDGREVITNNDPLSLRTKHKQNQFSLR